MTRNLRAPLRSLVAIVVVSFPLLVTAMPSSATDLPSGEPNASTVVNESFTGSATSSAVTGVAPSNTDASLPCLSSATNASRGFAVCASAAGAPSGDTGALVLTDGSTSSVNASGFVEGPTFKSTSALYVEFQSQSFGAKGGQRTLWLVDGATSPTSIPSSVSSAGYGAANGGIANAVLGVTFDATGDAATSNGASCPAVGWKSSKATANEVVVRAGDTSNGKGSSGYCFVASTAQPTGSLNSVSTVGSLHQSFMNDGSQKFFVALLPPSFTNGSAQLEVAVDAADGRGLVQVLHVALPKWAWPTDGTLPPTLNLGVSGTSSATAREVQTVTNFDAVAVAPTPVAPSAPTAVGVQWSAPVNGLSNATVVWSPPTFNGYSTVQNYQAAIDGQTCSVPASGLTTYSCEIDGIATGSSYDVAVVAQNDAGTSDPGLVVSSPSLATQTLTFPALGDVRYGAPAPTLAASATSGLAPAYSATGSCTMGTTSLTITRIGTCTVTASQPGDASFQAATPVTRSFTVLAGLATISVNAGTTTFDGSVHGATASVTPAVSGLTMKYCAGGGSTCSTSAPTQPGTYAVTAVLNNPYYDATAQTATLTITPPRMVLPPALDPTVVDGGTSGGQVSTAVTPATANHDGAAAATGSGFHPGDPVALSVIGQETLGSFTISSDPAQMASLLTPSSSSTALGTPSSVTASTPEQLSVGGTLAFPNGNFPGSGSFVVVPMTMSGMVPGTTIVAALHSSPIELASTVVGPNGSATLNVPIPSAFAGQTHELLLAGEYVASTTTADGSGSVNASIGLPATLLSRLQPGSTMVIYAVDTMQPSITATNVVTVPAATSSTTTTTTTPNNLPVVDPIAQPKSSMKTVTKTVTIVVTLVASAVAAASAARSAASAAGSAATARPASSGSSSGGGESPLSATSIGAAIDVAEDRGERVGDRLRFLRRLHHPRLDAFSRRAPFHFGRYSPLLGSVLADSFYLRAIVGVVSLALPVAAGVLSAWSLLQTHGFPLPSSLTLFAAITVLGLFDAVSGFVASTVMIVGAAVTGHLNHLGLVVSCFVIAALWMGLPIMTKRIRPFIRPEAASLEDWWRRLGDVVIGSLFAGFLTQSLVSSLPAAANIAVPVASHASTLALWAIGVTAARYVFETIATALFPKRLAAISVEEVPQQLDTVKWLSLVGRVFFTAVLLHAFTGFRWIFYVLLALQMIDIMVAPRVLKDRELPTWLYRAVPRGLVLMMAMSVIGNVVSSTLSNSVSNAFWQVAFDLVVMSVVQITMDVVSAADGSPIPLTWATRFAGVAVVLLTALQLTGHLV